MSESTAIALPNIAALQAASAYAEPEQGVFGTGANFLPRLQLFTSNSDECKRGVIPVATYGVFKGKETLIEIGKTVVVIPLAWRAKAMFLGGDKPVAFHDPKSKEFADVRRKADADSNSKNMYGPEFLLWTQDHGYVTFFCGSKTARNAAPAIRALLPTATGQLRYGVLSAEYINNDKYSWHGPKIEVSLQNIDGPPAESVVTTITDFLNPVDSIAPEAAPAASVETDR